MHSYRGIRRPATFFISTILIGAVSGVVPIGMDSVTYDQAKTHYAAGGTAWAGAWEASEIAVIRQHLLEARTAYANCLETTNAVNDPANAANLALLRTISSAYIDLADAALAMYDGADVYAAGRYQMTSANYASAATSFGSAAEKFDSSKTLFSRATGRLQSVVYAGTEFGDGTAYTAAIVSILDGKAAYMEEFSRYAAGWQHTALAYRAHANGDQATARSEASQGMVLFDGLRGSAAFGADAAANYGVLAALAGTPPSAPTTGPLNQINRGNTVFIGEFGLNLVSAGVTNGMTLGWFQAGSNVLAGSPDDMLIVSDAANFNVGAGTREGAWYDVNNRGAVPVINVKDPSLALRILRVNADGSTADVTDKTVTQSDRLTFRVDSNLAAVNEQRGAPAMVTIKVSDPNGNVYSHLLTTDATGADVLNSLQVGVTSDVYRVPGAGENGAMWYTDNANYGRGEYKAWAECNLNGMKDNYKDPSGADYSGKTITSQHTVTVKSDELSIAASTDIVVRNNDFAVLITGRPTTSYRLFVVGGVSEAPTIKPGQVGVTVDADNPSAATVTTDLDGRRFVGLSTGADTGVGTCTIRVERLDPATGRVESDTVETAVATG